MSDVTPDSTGDLFGGELATPPPVGRRGNVRIGTCSWSDPSLIKSQRFYPKGWGTAEKRLRYYATQFPVVEVDSSYYAMPDPANARLWVERTPADFVLNIKAFRALTGHQTAADAFPPEMRPYLPPLQGRRRSHYYADLPADFVDELWRRFIEAVAPLQAAGKLRAVHFQFAPWMTAGPEGTAHVEECVRRMAGHRVAVEFRNASWFGEGRRQRTLDWERELGVAHVIVDEPQGVGNYAHGVWAVTHPQLAVVRLHGRNAETWDAKGLGASSDRFNYEYSDEELSELARQIDGIVDQAFEVHALLNVNFEDQGVRAARRLHEMMQRLGA